MAEHDSKQRGIEAYNRDFIRYEQVDKTQAYRLAEADGKEGFDDETPVPVIDFARWLSGDAAARESVSRDLVDAVHHLGFAILENHGRAVARWDEAEERVRRLFETTPVETKLAYRAARVGAVNQGYFPIKDTSDIHPDLVEGWVWCRRAFDMSDDPADSFHAEDFWPDPESERFFRGLVTDHLELAGPIARSILTGLGVRPDLLDRHLQRPSFALRMNYYPPISPADDASGAGRLLGHEDVTLFTLLPAPEVEGLQVLNRRNGKWIRLAAPRDSLILNTGDYMQRISNDTLPSTTHRVAKPRHLEQRKRPRVSFPLNIYLPEDSVLEVLPGLGAPRYEPIEALLFHTRTTAKYYGDDYATG